jgi:hypothetical protein
MRTHTSAQVKLNRPPLTHSSFPVAGKPRRLFDIGLTTYRAEISLW